MDGVGDLMTDGALGIFKLAIDTMFSIRARASRGELAERGERALVAVFMLEHVEGFLARTSPTTMRWTHTQAVDDELAHADRAFTFNVGRTVSRRTTCSCLS